VRVNVLQVLVFSQFTSMLELLSFRLEQTGLNCVKLEGSMTLDQREIIIDRFTNDPKVGFVTIYPDLA
jgi:DNA repair protein RAD16